MGKIKKLYEHQLVADVGEVEVYPITASQAVYRPDGSTVEAALSSHGNSLSLLDTRVTTLEESGGGGGGSADIDAETLAKINRLDGMFELVTINGKTNIHIKGYTDATTSQYQPYGLYGDSFISAGGLGSSSDSGGGGDDSGDTTIISGSRVFYGKLYGSRNSAEKNIQFADSTTIFTPDDIQTGTQFIVQTYAANNSESNITVTIPVTDNGVVTNRTFPLYNGIVDTPAYAELWGAGQFFHLILDCSVIGSEKLMVVNPYASATAAGLVKVATQDMSGYYDDNHMVPTLGLVNTMISTHGGGSGGGSYTIPMAEISTLGGIKVSNVKTSAASSLSLQSGSTSGRYYGVQRSSDGVAFVNVPWTESANISAATPSSLGGIRLGYTQTGKNYPVQLDSNNRAYVNVPWQASEGGGGSSDITLYNLTFASGAFSPNVYDPESSSTVTIQVPTTLDHIADGSTRRLSNYAPLSALDNYVTIAGAQTITGVKTFGNIVASRVYLSIDPEVYLEYDAQNNGVKVVGAGLYSNSYISAGGVGSTPAYVALTGNQTIDGNKTFNKDITVNVTENNQTTSYTIATLVSALNALSDRIDELEQRIGE